MKNLDDSVEFLEKEIRSRRRDGRMLSIRLAWSMFIYEYKKPWWLKIWERVTGRGSIGGPGAGC